MTKKAIFYALILFFGLSIATFAQGFGTIPSPEKFLGFRPGNDYRLANYETIVSYFQKLAQSSPRIKLQELGQTTEGRPFYMAIISSPQNLANTAKIISDQARLSDPRNLRPASARRIIKNAKVIVSINCTIHPDEIGPSQMAMELAYQLITDEREEIKFILDNVVLLLIPAHNPDGLDMIVDWYNKYRGTKFEASRLPFLYHKYSGHDLNRDWFTLTQAETRLTVEQVYNVWRPHIVLDLHQLGSYGARMFLPPYLDPYDDMIDPILQAEIAMMGTSMATDLIAHGNSGVAYNAYFDSFSPARTYINYHGGIRILGEIASVRIASPLKISSDQLRANENLNPTVRSWNNPLPWQGGTWKLSHIVDYALTASFSLLQNAAHHHELWLTNAYRVARNSVNPTDDKPTFLIPPKQHDPYAVYELLALLHKGMVEIYQAKDDFVADETLYPKGTYIIPAVQPYGAYARTLLEVRPYPSIEKDGERIPIHPYDVSTHNLPLLFGVKVITVKNEINADLKKISEVKPPAGKLVKINSGNGYLLDYRSNQAVKALARLYDQSAALFWLAESVRVDDETALPPGTIFVQTDDEGLMQNIASEFSVTIYRVPSLSGMKSYHLRKPRVGLYQSYRAPMDEGWTRFVLEQYGIDFDILHDDDIKTGDPASQYDIIILPHQSLNSQVKGVAEGSLPPQYCGGLGEEGIDQLVRFVKKGGTLLALNGATSLPLKYFWLGVRNVVKGLKKSEYNVPGSLLKIIVDTSNPIGYGLPRELAGFNYNSPAFELIEGRSIAKYPGENLLLSGWLTGEDYLSLKTAVAEIPLEKGSVILVGLRPQFRAQARGTYKFLFNPIIKSMAKKAVIK